MHVNIVAQYLSGNILSNLVCSWETRRTFTSISYRNHILDHGRLHFLLNQNGLQKRITYLHYEPCRTGQAATGQHDSATFPVSISCVGSDMRVMAVLAHIKCLSLVKASSEGTPNANNYPQSLDFACSGLQVQFIYAASNNSKQKQKNLLTTFSLYIHTHKQSFSWGMP